MISGREAILGRIREALKLSAPMPGEHESEEQSSDSAIAPHASSPAFGVRASSLHAPAGAPAEIRAWLPPVGATWEENAALFARNSTDLKTNFPRCPTRASAHQALSEIAAAEKWSRVAFHQSPLVSDAIAALKIPSLEIRAGYDIHALERCDAGITACDALIAQTGTILLTAASAGGRTLSVLPPHHVVIATRDQLLPDLPAGYELIAKKYGSALPSFITLITGPSRTGDIERILVLGAHGPKKLTVLLVEEG